MLVIALFAYFASIKLLDFLAAVPNSSSLSPKPKMPILLFTVHQSIHKWRFALSILFFHPKAVQPKLKRALAEKANVPEYLWKRTRKKKKNGLMLKNLSCFDSVFSGCKLYPVIYGAFLHRKFSPFERGSFSLPFTFNLQIKPVNTITPPPDLRNWQHVC